MAQVEIKYYGQVSANSSYTHEYAPDSGLDISFREIGASAAYNSNVKVEIIWDNVILLCTHGDCVRKIILDDIANGTKKIQIKITNDTDSAETCGGYAIIKTG